MKPTYWMLLLILTSSGCVCLSEQPAPQPEVVYRNVSANVYSSAAVTTSTSTTSSTSTSTTLGVDYKRMYEDVIRILNTTTTTTSTTSTTTTSTTTTLKKPLKQVMPIKIKVNPEWTACKTNRDCIIVPDCCGTSQYGFKYAISSHYQEAWYDMLKEWCQPKDHRLGCGWTSPIVDQVRCIEHVCEKTYGGLVLDDLPDQNFTYIFKLGGNITYNKTF